jgi:hypothetical protein
MDLAGARVTALAHEPPHFLWSGHADGRLRLWSLREGCCCAESGPLFQCAVTALALDPHHGAAADPLAGARARVTPAGWLGWLSGC